MRVLGLITARAGSKGIKDKNKKLFAGKPLVEWTIEAALKAKMLDDVIVSTDDWDIAEIGKRCGARVPFIRPEMLAQDNTPHIDVVLHALREVGSTQYTHCCLLQPTSPLRTANDIDEALILAAKRPQHSVLSVTENREYPFIVGRGFLGSLNPPKISSSYLPRQKVRPMYHINGAIFISPIFSLQKGRSFYYGQRWPYIMPKERSYQIDDKHDFDIAEYLMYCRIEDAIS